MHTPQRKQYIKRIARGSQMSLVSSVVNSPSTSTRAISELARKIKLEMKAMNSDKHDSIFRNTYTIESIKHFDHVGVATVSANASSTSGVFNHSSF